MDDATTRPADGLRGTVVAVAAVAGVVAMHALRVGSHLRGAAHRLYYSYASDVLVPFAMYFILYLNRRHLPFLRDWRVRAVAVLAAASGAEVLQGVGVPALGRTFDPLDFAMYGAGVLLAALVERTLCGGRDARGAR